MKFTKFILAILVFATATALLVVGQINQNTWETVVLGNVFVYAGGNVGATFAHRKV